MRVCQTSTWRGAKEGAHELAASGNEVHRLLKEVSYHEGPEGKTAHSSRFHTTPLGL